MCSKHTVGVCPSSPKVCSGSGLGFDTGGLSLSKSGSIYEPRNEGETLKSPGTSLNFHSVTCGGMTDIICVTYLQNQTW